METVASARVEALVVSDRACPASRCRTLSRLSTFLHSCPPRPSPPRSRRFHLSFPTTTVVVCAACEDWGAIHHVVVLSIVCRGAPRCGVQPTCSKVGGDLRATVMASGRRCRRPGSRTAAARWEASCELRGYERPGSQARAAGPHDGGWQST